MKFINRINIFLFGLVLFSSCQNDEPIVVTSEDYHTAIDKITEVQVHDIFSPPVASRIYAYSNIAAYEALQAGNSEYKSLAGQLNELTPAPAPKDTTGLNLRVSSIVAFYEIGKSLIFSEESVVNFRDSIYKNWESKNPESFRKSKAYGLEIATHIKGWMSNDNYAETRTMPKFSLYTEDESRWQPTPPSYMDGIEPHWMKIRPFVIDSAAQFRPAPPPEFSMEPDSRFYKELTEVYEVKREMDEIGDSNENEKLEIAKFWDCNPYVSTQKGHLMFATKKITPGGHWIGITKIACRKSKADFNKTVYAYTRTSIAIADGFISCWDEKYRSNLVRPETLINKYIDENWSPVLQTPPFPEYTSGHSVVSGAAAIVLTDIFGDNFSFEDDTEVAYGLPVRNFNSFNEASLEAANSRLFGGIHYRAAIEVGLKQGRDLGNFVVNNLQLTIENQSLASN
ncbi:vanadium-dependent haloperoxidase [Gramella lutea]|uniref:Vanadium-dependent haloperoxidase n=1 Tax=Christiangramia lutea TaxID=1607951 RepID=A0A9X1V1X1_9FLAO|nr:vanadium-dependent haloperoxidase [Christiangramia lutea]MCH4822857.1 vanadium-dependent haloperoxidase [Christiangramia lutea]